MLVGHALLEGRTIGMRNAGTTGPAGRGYSDAFNEWLTYNRFDMSPSHRSKLLTAMGLLPEIEAWRATLTTRQRRSMNHPGRAAQLSEGDQDQACSRARHRAVSGAINSSQPWFATDLRSGGSNPAPWRTLAVVGS